MKVSLFIGFLLLTLSPIFSQISDRKYYSREVVIHRGDTLIRTSILTGDYKGKLIQNRRYYWYSKGEINSNFNGYAGKLLHGDYLAFKNNSLIEKGQFNTGLKTGEWNLWYQSGRLKTTCNFRNGILNGKYYVFSEDGKIEKKGNYRNGNPKNIDAGLVLFHKKKPSEKPTTTQPTKKVTKSKRHKQKSKIATSGPQNLIK